MTTTLTLSAVAQHLGKQLPEQGRCYCPVRQHKRDDKTASVFRADSGDMLLECFSCDAPENVWDAIGLFAAIQQVDRKEAWHQLRRLGFAVPGLRDPQDAPQERRAAPPSAPAPASMPITGRPPRHIIPLDPHEMDRLRDGTDVSALEAFAAQRRLPLSLLMQHGLVTVPTRQGVAIGFVYCDAATGQPCRLKCKHPVAPDRGPAYFIIPARQPGQEGSAAAPLYLGNLVKPGRPALIQEGEVDALSVASMDFDNAVSLPDGADSARHCCLQAIEYCTPWLICTDADPAGDRAAASLMERARTLRIDAVRVRWHRLSDDGGLQTVKDANEALLRGFRREDFVRSLRGPLVERYGFDPCFGGQSS